MAASIQYKVGLGPRAGQKVRRLGTMEECYYPEELLEKLAALVPIPRVHLIWRPAPAAAARLRRELSRTTKIIAAVLQTTAIEETLSHLGLPTTLPRILPARAPPQEELVF